MSGQANLGLRSMPTTEKDIFLCHNGADKAWVEMLAERIEQQPHGNRNLAVVFDKWDFDKGGNIVLDMERFLDGARVVGIVVSRAMLNAEWPTLERTIAVWSDPSGARGRVVPLLKENVTLPASLRVRNWIDFREPDKFEDSFAELIRYLRGESIPRGRASFHPIVPVTPPPYEPAPVLITSSLGADKVNERLVANLYRVTSLPEKVYYASTKLRKKKDINEYCENAPPFILREGMLYTFYDLNTPDAFGSAIKKDAKVESDVFKDWFSDEEYRRRAIELLNVYLKKHAWKRRLRFDGGKARYFFTPHRTRVVHSGTNAQPRSVDGEAFDLKPTRIAWEISGRIRWREVTTGHTRRVKQEDSSYIDAPFGWRHQGFRANFMLVLDSLMLKLEPTYLLTKDDGKTPRTNRWVGPILSHWLNQERNGQILRSLRFWSLVLAKGNELTIETGQTPIRVDLAPISGSLGFGIASDQVNFDSLMEAEIRDDVAVPQLELFGEESSIAYTEENQFAEEDREDENAPDN
jgi:TIR domain